MFSRSRVFSLYFFFYEFMFYVMALGQTNNIAPGGIIRVEAL